MSISRTVVIAALSLAAAAPAQAACTWEWSVISFASCLNEGLGAVEDGVAELDLTMTEAAIEGLTLAAEGLESRIAVLEGASHAGAIADLSLSADSVDARFGEHATEIEALWAELAAIGEPVGGGDAGECGLEEDFESGGFGPDWTELAGSTPVEGGHDGSATAVSGMFLAMHEQTAEVGTYVSAWVKVDPYGDGFSVGVSPDGSGEFRGFGVAPYEVTMTTDGGYASDYADFVASPDTWYLLEFEVIDEYTARGTLLDEAGEELVAIDSDGPSRWWEGQIAVYGYANVAFGGRMDDIAVHCE
jgi:hypothetical protein